MLSHNGRFSARARCIKLMMICPVLSAASILIGSGIVAVEVLTQPLSGKAQTGSCYPPKYTESGDLILPESFREWVFIGSSVTPNALNDGHAFFPEFHNVYMEPCAYRAYEKTGLFPDETILFKELQLTLAGQSASGSRAEPSGRGYFPGPLNGADVMIKDSKRYGDTGGWGYYSFNHHEPKAPTAKVKVKGECAYCHIASAKNDQVWTQFYPLLDK